MHSLASFNHRLISADKTKIPAISPAALYGRGVFTTIAIYRSRPFLWEKHWQRIVWDASRTGVDLSEFTTESVEKSLSELIAANKIETARARLTLFDVSPGPIWPTESKEKTVLLIQTANSRPETGDLKLTFSPLPVFQLSPLAGVKSCNYLESVLAVEQARKDGFDEGIRLNEGGEVVSACLANIFWIKNGTLYTPDLETGCRPGTTREFVIELVEEETDLSVKKVKANPADLLDADEIFLTSSGIGITEVAAIDDKSFATERAKHLRKKFRSCL